MRAFEGIRVLDFTYDARIRRYLLMHPTKKCKYFFEFRYHQTHLKSKK